MNKEENKIEQLAQNTIKENVTSLEKLVNFNHENYVYNDNLSDYNRLMFVCD